MIAFLNGTLVKKHEDGCIIGVAGVGYQVEVSTQTLDSMPDQYSEIKLLIYHHMTESEQRLFGFMKEQEKNLFERLITVKGIGPKLGLTILSGMEASQLLEAIVTQDVGALSTISGIGKKTAQRMVLELKDKLFDESQPSVISGSTEVRSRREEAVSALKALGFSNSDAVQAVKRVTSDDPEANVSGIVKEALSRLK